MKRKSGIFGVTLALAIAAFVFGLPVEDKDQGAYSLLGPVTTQAADAAWVCNWGKECYVIHPGNYSCVTSAGVACYIMDDWTECQTVAAC